MSSPKSKITIWALLLVCALWLYLPLPVPSYAQATLSTGTLRGHVTVTSWKTLRDADIVKQKRDDSCGAAALATILRGFYGENVTEEDILEVMGKTDQALPTNLPTFTDLAKAADQYGFLADGLRWDFVILQTLRIPVVVALHYHGMPHYSVLRGISSDVVWLGDPSWGNRRLSKESFLAMWEDPERKKKNEIFTGGVLLIVPKSLASRGVNSDFFHSPERPILPVEFLSLTTRYKPMSSR